ncbi:MAG: AAA family ATPase [Planctomycetia bacterium]|nr:AAA family ATPase [Planctomycetia bacterium]
MSETQKSPTADELSQDDLLKRLAGHGTTDDDLDTWASVAATQPEAETAGGVVEPEAPEGEATPPVEQRVDQKLDLLLNRINQLRVGGAPSATGAPSVPLTKDSNTFVPLEPSSWGQAQVTEAEVEELCMKYLLACGCATGVEVADQAKLPFKLIEGLLRQLKADQLLYYRGTATMGDYQYQLTDMGRERARRYADHCTYFGSAPVSLSDYIDSVTLQSLTNQHPSSEDLHNAFSDLLLDKRMLNRLGPAINSGRGLFLYGAPGNGKTSIAERVTGAFGPYIWIPRAIGVDGEIIRLYDPSNHYQAPLERGEGLINEDRIDRRWIRVRRPTIVAGGELTMSALEVTLNSATGISEAPLQLKSNCGTLVIDDFGRQRMSTDELLNRWIVPLEKRYDFLNLPNGKKVQVPFDQLIIFSTNLEPKDLVDDAFLRRIPYKIDVSDPSEQDFRELFKMLAPKMGFAYSDEAIDYLIKTHYRPVNRPFRCCQPRDLLLQIRNFCHYQNQPLEITHENLDFAVANYFAIM